MRNSAERLHRDVPPLHVAGCLFSITYVCLRPIDRSAPRAVKIRPFWAEIKRTRRYHPNEQRRIDSRRDRVVRSADNSRIDGEFFVDTHNYRSNITNLGGNPTGRRYRFGTGDSNLDLLAVGAQRADHQFSNMLTGSPGCTAGGSKSAGELTGRAKT